MKSRKLLILHIAEPKLHAEREKIFLEQALQHAFTPENFVAVHELVNRNRITRRASKIIRESSFDTLRPFRFLINKN